MSIKTDIRTPENTLNYMKYVEIENDSRFPPVTGGLGQGVFNKSAILVQQVDPYNINIPADSTGQGYIEKFGANLEVGTNLETIWETGGIYQYLTTASVVSAISDDAGDTTTGTGARCIELQGLDSNYNTITEVISTNGTSGGVPSTNEFFRIYRAVVKAAGSTGTNEGHINIQAGATTVISVGVHGTGANKEGFGQSQTSVYTVPAGKKGYITQWSVGTGDYGKAVHAYLLFSEPDDGPVLRTKDVVFLNSHAIKDYKIPLQVPEKTDIEVRAFNSATGTPVSTTYNVILIDNV